MKQCWLIYKMETVTSDWLGRFMVWCGLAIYNDDSKLVRELRETIRQQDAKIKAAWQLTTDLMAQNQALDEKLAATRARAEIAEVKLLELRRK